MRLMGNINLCFGILNKIEWIYNSYLVWSLAAAGQMCLLRQSLQCGPTDRQMV